MTSGDLRALIDTTAAAHGLDPAIVLALVQVESSGNPWAWNPEHRYRYFWDVARNRPFRAISALELANQFPPPDFNGLAGDDDNEWWGQQASWGLTQIMGAVARELGFTGHYLTALCDPAVNLTYGCMKLKAELTWTYGDVRAALACYNGGRAGNAPSGPLRNAGYAARVLART